MSRLKTGSDTTPGEYSGARVGSEVGEGRTRPGEWRARVLLVVAGIAAIVGLAATGCSGGDVRPACEDACRLVGLHAAPVRPFTFGDCRCVGGTAANGGAR